MKNLYNTIYKDLDFRLDIYLMKHGYTYGYKSNPNNNPIIIYIKINRVLRQILNER